MKKHSPTSPFFMGIQGAEQLIIVQVKVLNGLLRVT
jgi:hypothetical protein